MTNILTEAVLTSFFVQKDANDLGRRHLVRTHER